MTEKISDKYKYCANVKILNRINDLICINRIQYILEILNDILFKNEFLNLKNISKNSKIER